MSTYHKKNQITLDRQRITYNDPGIGLLYDNKTGRKSTIYDLDLAHGLIELLVENNFTLKSLLNTSSSELSKTLGIDEEVATLICKTAKSKKPPNKEFGEACDCLVE
jgi:hypothetical protein